jgi:hypothetical protein
MSDRDRMDEPQRPDRQDVPPGFPPERTPEYPVRPEPPGFPTEDPPEPARVPPEISPPEWEPGPSLPKGPDLPPASPSWWASESMEEVVREHPRFEID